MKKLFLISGMLISFLLANSLSVSFSGLKFDYKEYSKGEVIDSESSKFNDLYGINFDYRYDINKNYKINALLEYNRGKTKYKGSTWGGTSLSNYKDNVYLINGKLNIECLWLSDVTKYARGNLYLAGGLGYRFWNRGKSDYAGDYNEKYYWSYYNIGLKEDIFAGVIQTGFAVYYHKAVNPKMKADLYGTTTFNLGKTEGYRVKIPFIYMMDKNYGLELSYMYDYWKIRQSNVVVKNGVGMYEPESKTKNQYINFGIFYKF